jgi:hypothetical protein
MRNIIDSTWFINREGTVGIVLTEDEFKQVAYISKVHGDLKELDELLIMDYGSKLTKAQAIGFFGEQVNTETYKR